MGTPKLLRKAAATLGLARDYVSSARASRRNGLDLASLECFCLFLGYARSGHSLVGSLLDAHPDAVVAHEANALRYVKYGFDRGQLAHLLVENSERIAVAGRRYAGYSYAVPHQWQGRHRRLRVIGDKRGGATVRRLQQRPELLARLAQTVGVPVRCVHVVRNSFDNIATIFARGRDRSLDESIDFYFRHVAGVAEIVRGIDPGALAEIRHEALIARPVEQLGRLCQRLGLEPTDDYLKDCACIVFATPHRSREEVDWTPEAIARVQAQIDRTPFLAGYTLES